jgi:hypothetical protein
MKNKKIVIAMLVALIVFAVLFSGCTQQNSSVCGNETCDSGETFQNCPGDCPEGNIPIPNNADGSEVPPELPF